MARAGSALTDLALVDLERLLRAIHRKELACPVTHAELVNAGLSYLVDRVDFLKGLDDRAVSAVLVAVIAERRKKRKEN